MKLTKVHAAISFFQTPWLKPYIELNQRERANAKSDFESDFYKLMNNAVFGKTCENQKKRTNIRLVQDLKKMMDLVGKPTFRDGRIFGENLASVELQKTKVQINRPFYTGFAVLDLSKLHKYRYALFSYFHLLIISNVHAEILLINCVLQVSLRRYQEQISKSRVTFYRYRFIILLYRDLGPWNGTFSIWGYAGLFGVWWK